MEYREYRPKAPISSIVKCFWSIDHVGQVDAPSEPVLPDGCPEIVFNLADRFQKIAVTREVETQASAIISGQLRSRIFIRPTGRVRLFGIRFQPFGAGIFLGIPLSELIDQVVPLGSLLGEAAVQFERRIAEQNDFEGQISVAEDTLLNHFHLNRGDAVIAAKVTERIIQAGGRESMTTLRSVTGLGERRLERMFNRYVGISPKAFARTVRFQNVLRSLEASPCYGLSDVAVSFGYYDQPHMIHEFREFSGMSPLAYFESRHRMSDFFTTTA
jgi:AraC-like DNA-binding protein